MRARALTTLMLAQSIPHQPMLPLPSSDPHQPHRHRSVALSFNAACIHFQGKFISFLSAQVINPEAARALGAHYMQIYLQFIYE